MKWQLIFSALMIIGFSSASLAQCGYYSSNNHQSYRYNSYDRYYTDYKAYDRYTAYMNRTERRQLSRLVKNLREEERYAYRDGYLSRNERRRINAIKADINYLINPYVNRSRRRVASSRYGSYCR